MVEGRGGEEWYSSRTRTGASIFVWWKGGVENDGLGRCICMLLDQRHIARTRTGTNSITWPVDIFAWMFCLLLSYGSQLYFWVCFISVIVTGC